MSLRWIWKKPWGAAQLILLGGWAGGWLFNPTVGSSAEKDLAAPFILSLAALTPFVVILGILAGLGANGRPKLERISYIVFAAIAVVIANAFTYFPDDLFYCKPEVDPSCATSVTERLLGLAALETAALLHLGFALLVLGAIRLLSKSVPPAADRPRDNHKH